MKRDERQRADALDHYWDAVLRGEPALQPPPVENEVAAVIAHFSEHPISSYRSGAQERVRVRISARARELEDAMRTVSLSLPEIAADALPEPSWSGVRPVPRSTAVHLRLSAQLATALLVLLTLGLGYLALGPNRSTPPELAAIPAIVAATPPTSEAELSTVFTTTLPAAMVPTAGNLDFLLWNVTLDANTRGPASAQSWSCCPGPQITHVVEGELSIRVEGPLQVFRGTAVAQGVGEVPPGTEVTLRPGDTAVYSYDVPAEYANRRSEPVRIVGGGIFAGAVRGVPAASSHWLDYNEEYSVPLLPPGPLEATLVRATLPPQGEVPAPPAGALVLEVGASGDADIAQRVDGSLHNIGPRETTIYVLTLVPAGVGEATPMS